MQLRASVIVTSILLVALHSAMSPIAASAQEPRLRVSPEVVLPLADTSLFGPGGGASLTLDSDAFGHWTPYAGMSARFIAPAASELEASLFIASADAGLGLFAFPRPRLKVGSSAGVGVYVGSYSSGETSTMTGNLFWRIAAEGGYRFTPGLTFLGGLSYVDYRTQTDSFYQGLVLSIGIELGMGNDQAQGRAVLDASEVAPIFPILADHYAEDPFGSLTIRNAESAEMRNVEIWFSVDGYSSGPALCARVPYLRRGAVTTVPLLAVLSDNVMTLTETVRVGGEVRVVYDLLGERRTSTTETTISINHRNALTWVEPAILAAFVSPNDPMVLDVSKYIAGIVRSQARPEIDSSLQYGIGVFEGLRLSGLAWSEDPQTPYSRTHRSSSAVDYIQYPHQTISYRGGDSDDLAVLYAAALESIGVPAAVIAMDSEVLAAFRMDGDERATRHMFLEPDGFLFVDGEAWVPVRVSMLREGFLQAWNGAAQLLQTEVEPELRIVQVSDAWQRYPPAGVPDVESVARKPEGDQLRTTLDSVVSLIVGREVTPRVEKLRSSFGPDGGNGRQRNYVGVTYARYGMYVDALAEFQIALELGYAAATMNVGNVAFLLGDFASAVEWFEQAYDRAPRDPIALIGLARSLYELDRYDEADRYFQMATDIRPDLAQQYVYLSARLSGSEARASTATERSGDMLWGE